MCTKNPGISVESLSLSVSLSLVTNHKYIHYPWIVPECVSMSICYAAISNLSRSLWLRRSATGRFSDYSEAGTVNGVCKRNTVRMCMLCCVCGRVRLEGIEPLLLLSMI